MVGRSRRNGRNQSAGGSLTISPVGVPIGGGLNAGRSKVNSNYQSVTEQSGIQAGDGGFQVSVKGDTDLKGAVIASSQTAVEQGKNRFSTEGALTASDLHNSARYEGQAVGINASVGNDAGKFGVKGVGAGVGQDSGSAQGTTTAGISGIAGDQSVRTGDATGIERIFDQNKVQREIDAQVAITAEFGKQASKAVGDYAGRKYNELKDSDPVEAAKWSEGGAYRVAMHAVVGGLSGGVQGLMGATAASTAAPYIDQLQEGFQSALQNAGLGEGAAKVLASLAGGATATTIGAVASGGSAAGAATAFNADMNNRQLHAIDKINAKNLSAKSNGKYSVEEIEEQLRLMGTEMGGNRIAPGTIAILKDKVDFVNNRNMDPSMPLIVDGNVAIEKFGNINSEIQEYIIRNTLDNSGWIPGQSPYIPNKIVISKIPQGFEISKNQGGLCSNLDTSCLSGIGVSQNKYDKKDIVAAASLVGRVAGIVSNSAVAASAIPGPHVPLATATGFSADVVDFVSKLVESHVNGTPGGVSSDLSVTLASATINEKFPGVAPLTNELLEIWKNSSTNKSFTDWINEKWGKYVEPSKKD